MFLAALTAVELYFAILYDQSDSFNMTNVSKHWFARHIEPVQKVLRFSDREKTVYRDERAFPHELAAGQHHICFVGDSFTFGHGVPNVADRFSDRLGASLERQHPGRFVVSNLADAGRDVHWVQKLLEELAADKFPVQTVVYVVPTTRNVDLRRRSLRRDGSISALFRFERLLPQSALLSCAGGRRGSADTTRFLIVRSGVGTHTAQAR
jgi:hypothetical protein